MRVESIAFHKMRRILCLTGVAVMISLPMHSWAASSSPSGGITVAPAELMLDIAKGSSGQDAAISVKNNSTVATHLAAAVEGLQQANDGTLVPTTGNPSPSLAAALTVTPQDFLLQPSQSINVELHVAGNNTLAPGGSYAAVLIRQVPDKNVGQVAIVQAVSVTVFITKEAGATRQLTVSDLTSDMNTIRTPHYVTLNFQNKGNTNVIPRAAVMVFDPTGKLVATGAANQNSVMILPGRQLRLRTYLMPVAKIWHPGRYTVQVTYRYDGSDAQQTATLTHWVLPPLFLSIVAGVVGLMAIVARIIWWFWPSIRLRIKGKPKVAISVPQKTAPKTMDIIVKRRS